MKFSVPQLQKYKKEPLLIDETIDIKEMAISRFPERLVDLSPLHVVGQIAYKPNDRIKLDLNVTGTAVVETSINLERVEVPLDIVIDELYVQDEVSLNMFPLTDQVFLVENNQLIIDEIVLEDVIVELPIALEDAQDVDTSGDGWQIIAEEDFVDPEIQEENEPTQTLGDFFPDAPEGMN